MDWDLTLRAVQSLVATVGLVAVWRTLRINQRTLQNNQRTFEQRTLTDDRETWWKRFEWAYELSQAEDPDIRETGFEVLLILEKSDLAGKDESKLISTVARINTRRVAKSAGRLHVIGGIPQGIADNGSENDD